jgi:hypothetical protein
MARAGDLGADSVHIICLKSHDPWHGYKVTNVYHEKVGMSGNGPPSAPPSGDAAAVPPAGAKCKEITLSWHAK